MYEYPASVEAADYLKWRDAVVAVTKAAGLDVSEKDLNTLYWGHFSVFEIANSLKVQGLL